MLYYIDLHYSRIRIEMGVVQLRDGCILATPSYFEAILSQKPVFDRQPDAHGLVLVVTNVFTSLSLRDLCKWREILLQRILQNW